MLPGIFAAIHCKRFSRGSSPLCTANMCVEKSTANATFFSFSFQLAAERWRFAQFSRRRRLDRIGSDPNGTEQYGTDISFFSRRSRSGVGEATSNGWQDVLSGFMLLCFVWFSNVKIKLLQYVCAKRLLKY